MIGLPAIEAKIAAACARANRPREAVTLIAVSKLHPAARIREAYALGLRHFGENYAQELRDKHRELHDLDGLVWHAIGPVQVKNAKYIAQAASVFHALESLEVAKELSRRRVGPPLRCLVEVNVAQEQSKAGVAVAELSSLVSQVRELPNLEVVGLMTMPPLSENPESARPFFQSLAAQGKALGLAELSMGSTGDFEVAIEEGATMIRVGTALFGERPR